MAHIQEMMHVKRKKIDDLLRETNNLIALGWQPYGDMFKAATGEFSGSVGQENHYWVFVMVKYEKSPA